MRVFSGNAFLLRQVLALKIGGSRRRKLPVHLLHPSMRYPIFLWHH